MTIPAKGEVEFSPAGQRFRFACHPGVECFNACCRGLNMVLTPYDVLRLKNALGLTSGEFLEKHTEPAQEEQSRWPLIRLKMTEGGEEVCPFLTEAGCGVYEHRSSACRIYPLARATGRGYSEGEMVDRFFIVEEPHCKGFDQDREWTVDEWTADQGLYSYHLWNDRWMAITTHPKGPGSGAQAEKNAQMFYLASYNLDRFREFVFQTKFLELFDVDPALAGKARQDDEALLQLALDYMKFAFFGEKTMKLKGK